MLMEQLGHTALQDLETFSVAQVPFIEQLRSGGAAVVWLIEIEPFMLEPAAVLMPMVAGASQGILGFVGLGEEYLDTLFEPAAAAIERHASIGNIRDSSAVVIGAPYRLTAAESIYAWSAQAGGLTYGTSAPDVLTAAASSYAWAAQAAGLTYVAGGGGLGAHDLTWGGVAMNWSGTGMTWGAETVTWAGDDVLWASAGVTWA